MEFTGHTKIGFVQKAHKLKGAIKIKYLIDPELFATPEFFFLEQAEKLVPYFIEEYQAINSFESIVKLEDVNVKEVAEKLKGCSLYINEVVEIPNALPNFNNFEVIDVNTKNKATIKDVLEMPAGLYLEMIDGKIIPFNDDWIVDVDELKKEIHMNLPEGIWEL